MQTEDGSRQAWIILSICAAITFALIMLLATIAWRYLAPVIAEELRRAQIERPADAPATVPSRQTSPDLERIAAGMPRSETPVPIDPSSWVTQDDYPAEALRNSEQGAVMAALDVDQAGVPVRCSILTSSGHASLDTATCYAFMRSARFNHGLTPTGSARTRYWRGRRVVWRLPSD